MLTALAALPLAACQDEGMDVPLTDAGPAITVSSVDASAYMGSFIHFSVDLQDQYPLSTLKAELLFDESVVSDVTIRTREFGTYSDVLSVPLLANIPDGTATLRFTAQNTATGISTATADIAISRPNFDQLTLKIGDQTYGFPKTADYQYALTQQFPADASATVITPAVNSAGDVITLGWDGSRLAVSGQYDIPFAMGAAGVYTIAVDLMTLTVSPLGKLTLDLSSEDNDKVYNMVQNTKIEFPNIDGVSSWELDYDFFEVNTAGEIYFRPISGLYKLSADTDKKYLKVEVMEDEENTATLNSADMQAVWVIGSGMGRYEIGPSWNTTDGAYSLAQLEEKKHQITFSAGGTLALSGFSLKFFHQKGWGGEFVKSDYASIEDETGCFTVTDSGNIELAEGQSLEEGLGYQFIVDVTDGAEAAVLTVKSLKLVEGLSIKVNDITAKRLSKTLYRAPSVAFTQGGAFEVSGEVSMDGFNPDPDFLTADGKFNAVDGRYAVELHLDANAEKVEYARFTRVTDDGSAANLEQGGCYLQGDHFAIYKMSSPTGWPGTGGLQMAQVQPGIFQVTGKAVPAGDDTAPYGRFETGALNVKYFYQDGWGGEAGNDRVFTERAQAFLAATGDPGNIYLAEGVTLEEGATYVLTVDFTGCTLSGASKTSGEEVIDFYKK